VAQWNEVETRADVIAEEWFYTEPPGGTKLTAMKPGEVVVSQGMAAGSMRRLLRLRDEVNALGHEINEAVGGILNPRSVPQP
jgi:hypothetical protein